MFLKKQIIFTFLLFCCMLFNAQTSSIVYLENGSLKYEPYANKGQSNAVNTVPDFSYAGYKKGGVLLPVATVVKTISPIAGDNTQHIQDAIDEVEALSENASGFRGAILLTAGDYDVQGQLYIKKSGVVLRGEGQGTDGTVLNANKPEKHTFIQVGDPSANGISENSSSTKRITTAYLAVGSKEIALTDASGFSIGDFISVKKTVNQQWIDDLGMNQSQLCGSENPPDCVGWDTATYTMKHQRTITAISGNTITIDIPIVDVIEDQYGGGEVSKASLSRRIENCGIENLRIESAFTSNTDENHAWTAISFRRVINSWVKKVTGQYLAFGTVSLSDSDFNTIEECASIDYKSKVTGSRRYGFNISSGTGNLFQRCYTNEGRHDYVTGSRVLGPNVFLDCYATDTSNDIGPHQRWATGLLFDNVRGGEINVRNRGNSGTGHGWAGAQTMFWNLESYQRYITVTSPNGAQNWAIGCVGKERRGNNNGFWESWNTNVTPRSLYLQQLEDRLGAQAVNNIAVDAQKTGKIYDELAAWKGEGELFTSIEPQMLTPSNLPAYESFDYPEGQQLVNDNANLGKPHWFQRTSRADNDTFITASPTWTATDLQTPTGNAYLLERSGADIEFVFNKSSSNTYASFLFTVTDLLDMDESENYIVSFGYESSSSGNLVRNANIYIRKDATGNGYNLGVNDGRTSGTIDWDATSFTVNQELFLVFKKTGATDISLYINPNPNAEAGNTALNGGSRSVIPDRLIFYQQNSASTPRVIIDELRVSENWNDATVLSTSKFEMIENSIYPNPVTNGKLFIKSKNNLKKDISIYSILGNKVFSKNNVTNSVDVSNLAKGYYILKIKQENNVVEVKKIMIN